MKELYIRAMDRLFMVCMWISGICLLVLTTVIPFNVFMRYVMNAATSWAEPLAIIFMIIFTFVAAAVCYRANMHIAVMLVVNVTKGRQRMLLGWITEFLMVGFALFVMFYGVLLVQATWDNYLAEFTYVRIGITYLPLPIGGFITLLFIIERIWTRQFFPAANDETPASSD